MLKTLAGRMPAWCLQAVRGGIGLAACARFTLQRGKLSRLSQVKWEEAMQVISAYSPCPPAPAPAHRSQPTSLDLSIILPVYNAAPYVAGCIRSILSQETAYTFEILAVDDCSTDNSLAVLQGIKDSRLVILPRKENGGSARARNDGLNSAKGRYLMFADADDCLLPGAIETLLSTALGENADVVQGQYAFFESDPSRLSPAQRYPTGTIVHNPLLLSRYPGTPWMKVFRRETWAATDFLPGNIYEDTVIWYLVFPRVQKFICLPANVYAYRQNGTGITADNKSRPKAADAYWAVAACLRLRQEAGLPVDDAVYRMTVIQMSQLLYSRNCHADSRILECLFALASALVCSLHQQLPAPVRLRGAALRGAESALLRRDYGAWSLFSRAIK